MYVLLYKMPNGRNWYSNATVFHDKSSAEITGKELKYHKYIVRYVNVVED